MRSGDTVSAEDGDAFGVVEDRRRPVQRVVVGAKHRPCRNDQARLPSRRFGALQEYLAGNDDDGDAVLLDGRTHRHLEDPRCHLRGADEFAVDTAFAEQILRVGLLEVLRTDLRARDVRRYRQHRHAAALCVEKAVDQVQIARTATAGANRQPARQGGVGGGSERRGLLVTHVLPIDFAGAANGVGEAVEAVSRQAVDAPHPADLQCGNDMIGDGCHRRQRSAGRITWGRSAGQHPDGCTDR